MAAGRRFPLVASPLAARAGPLAARARVAAGGAARPDRQGAGLPAARDRCRQRWSGTAVTSRPRSRATRELKRGLPEAASFGAGLLREPWTVATRTGGPYQVFTPFWRALQALGEPDAPLPAVRPAAPSQWPQSLTIEQLGLRPAISWDAGLADTWTPGEPGAHDRLEQFRDHAAGYDRDHPSRATSRLSPHLHFGEISPRQVWRAVRDGCGRGGRRRSCASWAGASSPTICSTTFPPHPRSRFVPPTPRMPWRDDPAGLAAWQRGRTGYPLVDAGMRELWQTGWMHNRVRMVAASFLTKNLLIDWRQGERWFWDTLVDADLANNTLGWQWVAGSGADAAPYFRIFNPAAQAERFDRDGRYRARWLGEGEAATPIVDHAAARERALAAYGAMAVDRSNHPS